jgi:ABC-type Fe3+-siderophore transport system permease subunit
MAQQTNRLLIRTYLSVGSAFSFLFLVLSGIALYSAPQCKVAEFIHWRFLLLGKESWEAVHISFALMFAVLAPLHLWYNWSTFASYFRRSSPDAGIKNRPVLLSLIIAMILFLMSALRLPPVIWIHDIHEKIKKSWAPKKGLIDIPGLPLPGQKKIRNSPRGRRNRN